MSNSVLCLKAEVHLAKAGYCPIAAALVCSLPGHERAEARLYTPVVRPGRNNLVEGWRWKAFGEGKTPGQLLEESGLAGKMTNRRKAFAFVSKQGAFLMVVVSNTSSSACELWVAKECSEQTNWLVEPQPLALFNRLEEAFKGVQAGNT